jgi:hypothetical protein
MSTAKKPGEARRKAAQDLYNERMKIIADAVKRVHDDVPKMQGVEIAKEIVGRAITLGFAVDAKESNLRRAEQVKHQKGNLTTERVIAMNTVYALCKEGYLRELCLVYGTAMCQAVQELADDHIAASNRHSRMRYSEEMGKEAQEPAVADIAAMALALRDQAQE